MNAGGLGTRPHVAGPPRFVATVVVALGVLLLPGCGGGEVTYTSGYEPAHLEEVSGLDVKQVELTKVGADQLGVETATAVPAGDLTAIAYAALIYDGKGVPWAYTVTGERTFLRQQVTVDHVEGDEALLSDGVSPGTRVVTTGAAELWGAELEIAGGH
jgi:hypothetical protein